MPLRFLTSGESHGPALLAILEGLPAGLHLSVDMIQADLSRRQKGYGSGPRMKLEGDRVNIVSGLMEGMTIGSPLGLLIENQDHQRWKGKAIPPFSVPRPGHADLVGTLKYGYSDLRPALERASARETAARVAVGTVCKYLLSQFGVSIGGYVVSIGEITAEVNDIPLVDRSRLAEESEVRCPEPGASEAMRQRVFSIMQEKDTLGGVIEVVAIGLPVGLGSYVQWDRRLDARLGAAVLSIPAIKGVEIGPAFENSRLPGTQAQDAIRLTGENISRSSLHSGGLEGGITTGQPLTIRAAMKPIATTLTPQQTVDLAAGIETASNYERSDFCPVPRAVPVVEAMIAYVLADALLEKLGGDSLEEMLPRFEALKRAKLTDIALSDLERIWWSE
jgi:chorismate synthase